MVSRPRPPIDLQVREEKLTPEDVAAEIAGKEPMRRVSQAGELAAKLRAMVVNTGLRVTWKGNDEEARQRAFNRVLESIKQVRRRATIDGIKTPQYTCYEGKDRSILIFRGTDVD